jgi:hypothetical protein
MSTNAARRQGVSCDACKIRRVKCDRIFKIETRLQSESEENIACSACTGHGLRCTYIQNAGKSSRRGRRIVSFHQSQTHQQQYQSHAGPSMGQTDLITNPAWPVLKEERNIRLNSSGTSPYTLTNKAYSIAAKDGLFDVEGLTKTLLDDCFQGYFNYFAPCVCYLQMEILAARYTLYFSRLEENHGKTIPYWQEQPDDALQTDRPLSELLILAVGCIGASLLELPDNDFKFRLQDRLALRFQQMLDGDMSRRLELEGTDVVEACYIMSDPFLSVIGNSSSPTPREDFLRIRPATTEGIIRLVFELGIHRQPTLRHSIPPNDLRIWQSNGQYITEREMFRRMRIFWTIFMHHSFRSMREFNAPLIANDAYDWDLPRYTARQDGSYDSVLFCQREQQNSPQPGSSSSAGLHGYLEAKNKKVVCLQANHFQDFDIIQIQIMLRLAFVIRTVSLKFVSPRSQSRSILVTDIERAVSALTAWYQQLPSKITWETQSDALLRAVDSGQAVSSLSAAAKRNALKAFFLETLYHANVLNVWHSVDRFGTRMDLDMAETATLLASTLHVSTPSDQSSEATTPLSILSSPAGIQNNYEQGESKRIKSSTDTARNRLDIMTTKSFLRMTKMAREASRLNMVRASRSVLVFVLSKYALWGCNLARKLASKDTASLCDNTWSSFLSVFNTMPGCSDVDFVKSCVDDLIASLEAVDSFEGAADMCVRLRNEANKIEEDFKVDINSKLPQEETERHLWHKEQEYVSEIDKTVPGSEVSSAYNSTQGVSDVLLPSLNEADMKWMEEYLRSNTSPHSDKSTSSLSDFNILGQTAHLNLTSAGVDEDDVFDSLLQMSSNSTAIDAVDTDKEWSQLLAYSDAQTWADTQWQDTFMTVQ